MSGRNPNNLQELLKVCLEASGSNDDNQTNRMNPETQQWLQGALNSMTTSVIDEMIKCLQELKKCLAILDNGTANDETYSTIKMSVKALIDYTGSLDYAQDFHKIGGFDVLKPLLAVSDSEVRSIMAEFIGELVQNNPYCQEMSLSMGFLKLLLERLETDTDETVRIKCLYALSCLIRQNSEALKQFEDEDGFSVLLRTMQHPVEKLRMKSAFLLMNMCHQTPKIGDTLYNMGFVEQLAALLHTEHSPSHEYVVGALLALVTNSEQCRNECQRSDLRLKEVLETRIKLLSGKEESKEEWEYCHQILNLVFFQGNDGSER
ncbi:hsp70-binding protein 1-like isoform X1 [Centruroides sculpturatus]|uniref:hsp70-binding protein 1-like isoform X1 n=2 Tax=Centruroides sculpturatus TaxID=218467 RepID=UPI000C6D7CEA|nr:hsp70-binding protein 1-like isoform X1 [Centruroides sculpturatus]